jgi:hypothetical protein
MPSDDERELLAYSVMGGDGPTWACYGGFAAGMGIAAAIAKFVAQPALPHTPIGLVMAGGAIGGLVLGAILYVVVEHVYTNARLAALRAIHGLDVPAVEALLGRRYRMHAKLVVRATPETAGSVANTHATVATALAAAGVPVTTRADGDAIVIETGKLRTTDRASGIGRRWAFNNYEAYRALRAIVAALPPSRLAVALEGEVVPAGESADIGGFNYK